VLSELSDLLERGADRPSVEPDFIDLARRGRRRRYTQRATTGLAVVAVLALAAGVLLPQLRKPAVLFDTGPRSGVGSWEAVPEAPVGPRTDADVTSDDRRVVVFGGTIDDSAEDNISPVEARDGAVFDTKERTWTQIPAAPLQDVDDVELLDDGRLMAHDTTDGRRISAAFYDFGTGQWQETGSSPVAFWEWEVITWTGEELLVWGVTDKGERSVGAIWNPDSGWRDMAPFPLAPRLSTAWSWAGDRLLVWGGGMGQAQNGEREQVFDDGMAYFPDHDEWRPLPDSPLEARQAVQGLWTGDDWIVMGGWGAGQPIKGASNRPQVKNEVMEEKCDGNQCTGSAQAEIILEETSIDGEDFADGARYDLDTGEWTPVATPPVGIRGAVWLGVGRFQAGGKGGMAEYDPANDSWRTRSDPGLASDRWVSMLVGDRTVIVNTTYDTMRGDVRSPGRIGGLVYNDRAQRWDPLTEAPTSQRAGAAVTTVGDRLFIWGGESVTRDISQGYSSADGDPWQPHADGAILSLD
jgi:hypothetical protein